jgi:hypothetical protein
MLVVDVSDHMEWEGVSIVIDATPGVVICDEDSDSHFVSVCENPYMHHTTLAVMILAGSDRIRFEDLLAYGTNQTIEDILSLERIGVNCRILLFQFIVVSVCHVRDLDFSLGEGSHHFVLVGHSVSMLVVDALIIWNGKECQDIKKPTPASQGGHIQTPIGLW